MVCRTGDEGRRGEGIKPSDVGDITEPAATFEHGSQVILATRKEPDAMCPYVRSMMMIFKSS